MQARIEKPGLTEWLQEAGIVLDRLTDCVHVYKNPPYIDVFMSDAERQTKTDQVLKLLYEIYSLVDHTELSPNPLPGAAKKDDEAIIGPLAALFRQTLQSLPWLSADMQKLLKSPWMKSFPNKIAETLFSGDGKESTGIGSGHPIHGRLPAALEGLLEREQMGTARVQEDEAPQRADEPYRQDTEARTRWAKRNNRFLRTAGRVE